MGNLRERYNAKARKSSRPAKRAKHSHHTEDTDTKVTIDPNADIIAPKSKVQKEADRRERLKQEIMEQQAQSKFTAKKKKRLEKYIDKKLKKEERLQLFEKLAQSQAQLPSILHLQPSSTLGSQRVQTNEDIKAKLEDKQVRRAIGNCTERKGKRRRNTYSGIGGATDSEDDFEDDITEGGKKGGIYDKDIEMDGAPELGSSRASPVIVFDGEPEPKTTTETPLDVDIRTIGSALRKNPDGSVQAPKVFRRKPKGQKTMFRGWGKEKIKGHNLEAEEQVDSDTSFNSSDSSLDSSESNEEEENEDSDGDVGEDIDVENDRPQGEEEDDNVGGEALEHTSPSAKRKRTGFKDWAVKQLSEAKTYIASPSSDIADNSTNPVIPQNAPVKANPKAKALELRGPLGEDLQLPSNALAEQLKGPASSLHTANQAGKPISPPGKHANIQRKPEIQEARLQLPILAEEQPIVEAVRLNPVVVICGETGSGKTTQVPQFLYEAGFGLPESDNPGMIGITQPRRVAAMSMASRVSTELNLPSSIVSYQIRYDATTAPTTSIKFMTDGVLLRELASDFSLSKYSVIIVDEAHERSVNTDILIGVLSRVVKLREELWKEGKDGAKPLRLIIMSATLRVSDFVENPMLFSTPPPVIRVDARQYPVTNHFSRRTHADYVSEAMKKVSKIHSRLPPGGILVFLTGQNEITGLVRQLERKYGPSALEGRRRKKTGVGKKVGKDYGDESVQTQNSVKPSIADVEVEEMDLGDFHDTAIEEQEDNPGVTDPEALDTDEEDAENEALGIDLDDCEVPMHVLPLYSILPTEQQMKVFKPPPDGHRLVVVATNVAETSLTIPGIRYVVDCGRAKERFYDTATSVQSFRVNWISKASADQRAGRAGRTGPGHCYRLFSSAIFDHHFDKFAHPEILRMPIEGVVLQMKAMHIDTVTNFPFPTSPDRASLQKAEELLVHLGALETASISTRKGLADGHITELGKAMALFPLSPRFAKMLVSGRQHGCLPYVVAVVAALSVGDPFIREEALLAEDMDAEGDQEEEIPGIRNAETKAKELNKLRRKAFFKSQELHSRLGKGQSDIFRILSVVGAYEYAGGGHQFCRDHFVRPKAMEEIHKLRAQISSIVHSNFPSLDPRFDKDLKPPNELQLKVLRQLISSAFIDRVAARKDLVQSTAMTGTKYASCRGVPYRAVGISEDVFIHPQSIIYGRAPPDFVVFQEAVRSSQIWLKNNTIINPAWLANLGKRSLCTFSKPLKNSLGDLMVIPHFGPEGWELPAVKADSV